MGPRRALRLSSSFSSWVYPWGVSSILSRSRAGMPALARPLPLRILRCCARLLSIRPSFLAKARNLRTSLIRSAA